MKKIILALVPALCLLSAASFAQKISATTETISVDYEIAVESTLEILEPASLATNSDSRGFMKVQQLEAMEIKGIITNPAGVKSATLNGKALSLSSTGYFSQKIYLFVGNNPVNFQIIDNKEGITTRDMSIEREPDPVPTGGLYYALLIGIEDYEDPDINDLDNPVSDASALYDVLTQKYNFEKENATLLKNPTRDQIYDQLDLLSEKITDQDNLLIFYAGHGHWDEDARNGYWLPVDAQDDKKRDWMRNSAVTEYVREIKSNHTLLLTDACFGGSIFKTRSAFKNASMAINKLHETPSRKAITSGTLSEVPDESVFMRYLLKYLNNNDENHLPSEQLFYSIKPAILGNSDNIPQFGVMQGTGDEGGDFIFIKRNQTIVTD
ncbi:MAG: caspase family protein [Reichenbachiella sp.]